VKYIIALSISLIIALAGYKTYVSINTESICKSSETSTPYCRYKGKIDKIYLNDKGFALIFLNETFDIEKAKTFGYEITSGSMVAIDINSHNQFSHKLLDMATLAFQQDHFVELHTRGTTNGYLVVDRIWVSK
jgi:hypothetical protein